MNKESWKVQHVMDVCDCCADTAVKYLDAEEWVATEAAYSCRGDKQMRNETNAGKKLANHSQSEQL